MKKKIKCLIMAIVLLFAVSLPASAAIKPATNLHIGGITVLRSKKTAKGNCHIFLLWDGKSRYYRVRAKTTAGKVLYTEYTNQQYDKFTFVDIPTKYINNNITFEVTATDKKHKKFSTAKKIKKRIVCEHIYNDGVCMWCKIEEPKKIDKGIKQ